MKISTSVTLMMLSIMASASSNSMINFWFFMEMNFIAFFYLMSVTSTSVSNYTQSLYFLVQALGGILLIFVIMMKHHWNQWGLNVIMSAILLLKMGMAPFHTWFIMMVKMMPWETLWALTTLQKILPFMLMLAISSQSVMMSAALMNILISTILILNNTSIKAMLAVSSLFNMSWIIYVAPFNKVMASQYLTFYLILSYILIMYLQELSQSKSLTMSTKWNKANTDKMMAFIIILMGIPPFTMFLIKFSMFIEIFRTTSAITVVMMSSSSLLMYLYLSFFIMNTVEMNSTQNFWNSAEKTPNFSSILIVLIMSTSILFFTK